MFSCCAAETKVDEVQFTAASAATQEPPVMQPSEEPAEPKEPEPVKEAEAPAVIEPEAPPAEVPKQEAPAVIEPEAPPAEVPKQEEQSSAKITEFEVVLKKSPEKKLAGMHLDCSSKKTPAVKGIKSGSLISDWNAANPDKKVQIGDGIVRVNGADNTTAMITALKEETALTLGIRRVPEFSVCIDRTKGETLGITFLGEGTNPATVSGVHEGKLVFVYNQEAEAGKAVVPGDIVVDVNGVRGNKDEIVAAISRASGAVNLCFKHPTA